MDENEIIEKTLDKIKKVCDVDLELCEDFPGVKHHCSNAYFNVVISDRISESKQYGILESVSKKYGFIRIEPNGLNRIAIFPKF